MAGGRSSLLRNPLKLLRERLLRLRPTPDRLNQHSSEREPLSGPPFWTFPNAVSLAGKIENSLGWNKVGAVCSRMAILNECVTWSKIFPSRRLFRCGPNQRLTASRKRYCGCSQRPRLCLRSRLNGRRHRIIQIKTHSDHCQISSTHPRITRFPRTLIRESTLSLSAHECALLGLKYPPISLSLSSNDARTESKLRKTKTTKTPYHRNIEESIAVHGIRTIHLLLIGAASDQVKTRSIGQLGNARRACGP